MHFPAKKSDATRFVIILLLISNSKLLLLIDNGKNTAYSIGGI